MALTFTRRFSTPDDLTGDDYGGVAFGLRTVGGKDIIVPEGWDQTAAAVLASKYFRRAGVPLDTQPRSASEDDLPLWLRARIPASNTRFAGETDARQVFHRLAGCWTYWGWRLGYFATEQDARVYMAEMKAILAKQVWAPNSPQFFNTGIHWAYGITGEDVGQWADGETWLEDKVGKTVLSGKASPAGPAYYRPAPSACFILGVEDSLLDAGGIYDALTAEARIFKFGGGAGANFSKLRGAGEPLAGGGKSSGMMSFLDVFDAGGGTIKSGGISRRAAKIVVCDIDHPDVEQFISWKAHEEYRAACTAAGDALIRRTVAGDEAARDAELIPAGTRKRLRLAGRFGTAPHWPETPYTTDFDDPHSVYARAGGQNSNNSVRLPDAFIRAVKHDYLWTLIRRTDGAVAKVLPARALWDRVVSACWTSGDPGVHFPTVMNEWHTCPEDGEIRASNPCCTVGGTLVDTSEGRIRIDELVRMSEAGEELPFAYCRDVEAGRPTVRRIVRGWKSGEVRKLIRVTTDKGVVVECTPDHRWLTFAGGWVMAKHLRVGTSLRKIARHRNPERRNAVMIADRTAGTSSGAEYQHRWLWREVHGRIADGCDIHHRDEDPTNDRLSNLDERDQHSHRSEHTAGTNNPNAVDVTVEALAAVWSQVRTKTPSGWNGHIRRNGLVGKIPQAQSPTIGGKVRGKPWAEFAAEMDAVLAAANDRVVRIEEVEYADPVPVYDIEVEGTHNFGVSSSADPGTHSLVIHNSEYVFLDDTACNLGSVRLTAFSGWDGGPTFDADGYAHACRLATVTLDITVGMAAYPTEKICQGSINYRTLGLGYCDLGSLLMRWGMGYDSDAGRATAAALTCLMHLTAIRTSQEMAAELAPFPRYAANAEHVKRVMTNHLIFACRVAGLKTKDYVGIVPPPDVDPTHVPECLYLPLGHVAVTVSETVGRPLRNAQLTLLAPTGCLVAGSLVVTDRGLVRIGDLGDEAGDKWQPLDCLVATDEGPQAATKFFVNGVADVLKVTTSHGYTITGTPTHRVRVVDPDGRWQWVQFGEVKAGDRIPLLTGGMVGDPVAVPLPAAPPEYRTNAGRGVRCPDAMSPQLAMLVGLFHAEGSAHWKGLRWSLTAADKDLIEWCADACRELFGIVPTQEDHGGYIAVCLNSTQVVRWWSAAGFAKVPRAGGGKGHKPVVPDAVLATNDPDVYAAYLRGVFSGDGSTSSGLPCLTNANAEYIDDLRTLLLLLGVVTTTGQFTGGKSGRPVFSLRAANRRYGRAFAERIGFVAARKQAKLVTDDCGERGDRVFGIEEVFDAKIPVGHPLRADLTRLRRTGGGIPRNRWAEFGGHADGGRDAEAYYYDTVASVIEVPAAPTFDLSVPANVTYVANGFVSHNTIGLLLGCDTTGVEPDFSLVKTKQLVGGGYMQLVNQAVVPALRAMGLTPAAVDHVGRHVYGTRQVPAAAVALLHSHCGSAAEAAVVAAANAGLRAHGDLERAVREADAMGELAWDRLFPATPFTPGWRSVPGFRPLASLLALNAIDVAAAVALADDWQAEAGGRGTVDDCALLTDEQKAVFDCATAARPGGRCLTPAAHIDMMAAVQPALSGAISKTVNLPADASPEDVRAALWRGWEKRTKCVAVYVDGQKLSQPLTSGDGTGGTAGVLAPDRGAEADDAEPLAFDATDLDDADYADGERPEAAAPPPPARRLLPTRRTGVTQKFRLGGQKFYLRTGEYPDGTLGEIFLDMAMEGSAFRALGNAMAIAVSLGLQHGVPLEEYVEAFVGMRFEPAGVLQGHDRVKMATSFLDAIFKDLAIHYLGRDELAHVQPEPDARPPAPRLFGLNQLTVDVDAGVNPKGPPKAAPQTVAEPAATEWEVWDGSPASDPVPVAGPTGHARGSTGNLCPRCQNFTLRRTGTCQTCETCFFNSGCN